MFERFHFAVPPQDKFPVIEDSKIPGQMCFGGGLIVLNPQRKAVILKVTNTGDRPIQVLVFIEFLSSFMHYSIPLLDPVSPLLTLLNE